ncbi:hypothetical protein GCM10022225_55620 [Plantactinospora mayteni]|uniref:Lipoprotein n=1 Tax=Plantactinospora mayteni TaxID=566021 RepID=A0ABQ4EUV3_9ACTN|nr:hypothetical protein [Plantactinospora mayteni]GIG98400.1 hypothetical protein Pma05_49730 [Plantactinospora mayteni]
MTTVRRAAGLVAGLALGVAVLAGCSSEGATTDCGLDACTVTFDRGVDAQASLLGVEAKLIGVDGDVVTLEVAGEQLSLTVGQQATEVGGLYATVQSADADQVVVRIGQNAG